MLLAWSSVSISMLVLSMSQASGTQVSVVCPSLGTELQSALAARARADLLVRGTAAGASLSIVCSEAGATLAFRASDGAEQQATLPLPPEPRAAIERILEALDELLPPPAAPVAPPAVLPPPVLAPPAPVAVPAVVEAREDPRDVRDRAGAEIGLGVETELWSSEVLGAVGPRLGFAWAPEPAWALRGSAGPSWGIRAPDDVSGFLLRLEVGAEMRFGPMRAFRFAASALGERLAAVSGDQSTAELAFGGALRASYGAWLGDVRLSGGPLLLLHPGAVRVERGTRELFRIPAVTGGLAVEVSLAPWEEP